MHRARATDLAPPRTLLEAVADLLWGFTNGQVLLHIAAVPLAFGQLHAQSIILCQGVLRRPSGLLESSGPVTKQRSVSKSCEKHPVHFPF